MSEERILFVTGHLAAPALRSVVQDLAAQAGFQFEIAELGISVAALLQVDWIARKLPAIAPDITRVLLPGWCQGDLEILAEKYQRPVARGPKDLYDLPDSFGRGSRAPVDLSRYDIEILAEINHAPRLSAKEILDIALRYRHSGADVIDLGCIPGESWSGIADAVARLRDAGLRVSVDSFDRTEVTDAVAAGAELILSCNQSNAEWAADLPAELVVIPDDPARLETLGDTVEYLTEKGCRLRLDPILEPIGFGFAASLQRFWETRRRYPQLSLMMGIGNITELTEVDSAGVNFLLAAFCGELRIGSVLTTEVIPWCRTAVREFDIARRQVRLAIQERRLPKHLDSSLVMLRSPKYREMTDEELQRLQSQIKDPSFRIFAARGEIHVLNRDGYWHDSDPYALFDQLPAVEPAHAFYLGYELAKAKTALTLGKPYRQDEALAWGFLTEPEVSAIHRRKSERP